MELIDDRRSRDRGCGSDRRRAPRLRVLLSAALETPTGEQVVKLRNLSSIGALIETDRPPELGAQVVFKRGRTHAPGRVVWTTESQVGVQFVTPIQEAEVLIHIGKPSTHRR